MNNVPMPSYALQIEQEIRPALVGFMRGRKAKIGLPYVDRIGGILRVPVGFSKRNMFLPVRKSNG